MNIHEYLPFLQTSHSRFVRAISILPVAQIEQNINSQFGYLLVQISNDIRGRVYRGVHHRYA